MHRSNIEFLVGQDHAEADLAAGRAPSGRGSGEDYLIVPAAQRTRRGPLNQAIATAPSRNGHRKQMIEITTRMLDFTVAFLMLVLLAPVFVLLAVVVAVTSRTAPIFVHRRVGRNGRPFGCLKFRTMCHDAEARLKAILRSDADMRREWEAHHKLTNDPRVTPLGRFLRETSLDELPQLFNVLLGDMALVGPRPIVQAEMPKYDRYLSSYLSVRPGLTGLWQVTCRSESNYRRRVAIDHVYALRKCLLLDLRILFATVPAVLSRKGAC